MQEGAPQETFAVLKRIDSRSRSPDCHRCVNAKEELRVNGLIRRPHLGWTTLVFSVALVVGLLVAPATAAKKENVSFINKSNHTQQLLVAHGGDGECSEMPKTENLKIEEGETVVLESGDSKVCWCAGSGKNKVSECQEWTRARPGSKVRLTF